MKKALLQIIFPTLIRQVCNIRSLIGQLECAFSLFLVVLLHLSRVYIKDKIFEIIRFEVKGQLSEKMKVLNSSSSKYLQPLEVLNDYYDLPLSIKYDNL